MKTIEAVVAVAALLGQAVPVLAADSAAIQLKSNSKVERAQVSYSCGNHDMLTVTYVNAAPNFIAIVPLPEQPQPIVFVSVISGFGARYASGKFVWWTKGNEGSLYDTTLGENAPPVMTCIAKP